MRMFVNLDGIFSLSTKIKKVTQLGRFNYFLNRLPTYLSNINSLVSLNAFKTHLMCNHVKFGSVHLAKAIQDKIGKHELQFANCKLHYN